MALFLLHLLVFLNTLSLSSQANHNPRTFKPPLNNSVSLSFPLTSISLSPHSSAATFFSSLISSPPPKRGGGGSTVPSSSYNYRSSFKYSMALVVSFPIGTPPQTQQMVLDTGSQLSWIQCHKKALRMKTPIPTTSFDPSLSSSFSILPCTHPLCKPLRIPDFTLPTSCDQNRLCHYSYFYADGTLAEGNLVREKVTFSRSQSTPPLILGCAATESTSGEEAEGILGMNLGRFSFVSQAKVPKFSYCTPIRQKLAKTLPSGAFYLGQNPNSRTFQYLDILTFSDSQRMLPNLDPLAYSVGMVGMRVGRKKLNISASVFRPNAGGAGQTMIDSGTEYTFLVEEAYTKVREEIVRLTGTKLKKGYVYEDSLDMCFDGNPIEIGRLIGDMVFEFDKGVEITIGKERILDNVEIGVHCIGIGRSESLGVPSNIIGNFHQQNLWVEFDLTKRKVGFGKADCSRSV